MMAAGPGLHLMTHPVARVVQDSYHQRDPGRRACTAIGTTVPGCACRTCAPVDENSAPNRRSARWKGALKAPIGDAPELLCRAIWPNDRRAHNSVSKRCCNTHARVWAGREGHDVAVGPVAFVTPSRWLYFR
jgi:hypothetical protein